MKTLGQIAHEAVASDLSSWSRMLPTQRAEWESLAQAVATIELEACAKMFDDSPHAEMFRKDISDAIRARLK